MLNFPSKIKIKIVDGLNHNSIKIPSIIISIHLFAMKKNDYYLGPFFSDENGEIEIDKNTLEISAEAELGTGLMDYKDVHECSPLVEINILSQEEINNVMKGRTLWGIIGRENEIYNTKEDLLNRIRNNNNHLVNPRSFRVIWDKDIPSEITYEIPTNKK